MRRLAALFTLVFLAPHSVAAEPTAPQPEPPVILLTGFEPFGLLKPPNPSWEGIKNLDGRIWRGHKLVARQFKVTWGEPLVELRKAMKELHPAAVFAFGQGGNYALETRARNARGPLADNDGHQPPAPEIVAGGPAEFEATMPIKELSRMLQAKKHDVRLSTDAGSYLCEEMLYTLEWLKSEKEFAGAVGFCHVPSLGSSSPQGPVTPERVQQFVEDYLEAWHAAAPGTQIRGQSPDATAAEPANSEREQDVRDLIDRYFKSWSNQDMDRYGQCFANNAMVQLLDDKGAVTSIPLGPFLRGQREAHRQSPARLTETPESVDVRFEARVARVVVYWKLVGGAREEYGYDHFTLIEVDGKWRIANLLFYVDPDGAKKPAATASPPR